MFPSASTLSAVSACVATFSQAEDVVFHFYQVPDAVLIVYFVVVLAGSVDTIARPVIADICEQSIWLAVVVNTRAVFAI